jgi:ribonuclease P protein component
MPVAPRAVRVLAPDWNRQVPEALGFPRSHRILSAKMFEAVIACNHRRSNLLFTVYNAANDFDHARLGLTVSRKVSTRAVVRNRIKRIIRESFRHNRGRLIGRDIVVIAKPGAGKATASQIDQSLEQHWQTIVKSCASS